jgi:hypothetical protein
MWGSPARCAGSITLWSKTYLRGEKVDIAMYDIQDLASLGFDNTVVSINVSACCWTLYSEKMYRGDHQTFQPGQYKSVSDLGQLFRAASSVKQTSCSC